VKARPAVQYSILWTSVWALCRSSRLRSVHQSMLYLASWLHLILSRNAILTTSWTNESGPCNLVTEEIEMEITAGREREPHITSALLRCIVTLSAKCSYNCHWTASAALQGWRGCRCSVGNLPSFRLLHLLTLGTVVGEHPPLGLTSFHYRP
jgi:hypothetical protein